MSVHLSLLLLIGAIAVVVAKVQNASTVLLHERRVRSAQFDVKYDVR